MAYQEILTELRENLFYITINRPNKLNALNKVVLSELAEAIKEVNNNKQIRAGLITGSGEKAFVAGADIAEFRGYTPAQGKELAQNGQINVFDAIENCQKPIIAAINGFALGGGLELAMACHIRIASEHAKLGLPEVTLGLIPGYGGTQRLTRLVGKGIATEMITTADMITAERAEKIGLVNHVVPQAELLAKAEEILNKIKLRAPLAVAAAIKAINATGSEKGFEIEIEEFSNCFKTADFKEGVSAFLEKRATNFSAR